MFLLTYIMAINIIVPKNPVIAEIGISAAVNERQIISEIIINDAPNVIDRGIVFVVSRPTQSLTICGITRPIQLIVPAKATELAVNRVAIIIIRVL